MNWTDAINVMGTGRSVLRRSEQKRIRLADVGGVPVYECGTEPCMLAAAWTVDNRPVMVFRGLHSGQLFVPDDEDRAATDWEVAC